MNWERGWEALDIFKGFLKFSLAFLLWNSTLRTLLYYAVFRQWIGLHEDVPFALLAGIRFDLLVLAFFWFPVLLVTWLWALRLLFPLISTVRLFHFWKSYFTLVILVSALFIAIDFFFSAAHQSRINHEIWHFNWLEIIKAGFAKMGVINTAVVALWVVVTSKWMRSYLMSAKLGEHSSRLSHPGVFALQLLGSFLIVGLCARGTFTAHHLNREHASVSENKWVNELAVNPIWGLDN
jgi:hypothetical protein